MENKANIRADKPARPGGFIQLIIALLSLAAFAFWLAFAKDLTAPGVIAAALSLGVFTLALIIAVPRAIRFLKNEEPEAVVVLGDRSAKRGVLVHSIRVIFAVLGARVLVIVAAYVFARVFRGVHGSIFATLEDIWLKLDTDAPHYINIAENWYTTEYPGMYTLVFLPLFPLLIRACNFIFGSSFVSALVINTVCTCLGSAVLYRLVYIDMGRRSAKLSVLFALTLPAAIFYVAPMSEALFFMLSVMTLFALRRRKFWLAAVFGALAAFTRSLGVMLIVPFAAEAIAYAAAKRRGKEGKFAGTVIKLVVCGLILLLGTFAYLLINKLIWDDWFKFMEFQRDIWYQHMVPFFGTVSTQMNQLIYSADTETILGLWLPNLLFIFGALAVLIFSARTLRTPYFLYFAAYFAVACGASWLLSAPRYLTALVSIPIALAHLCQGRADGVATGRAKAKATAVTVIFIICQALYLLMYVMQYRIY